MFRHYYSSKLWQTQDKLFILGPYQAVSVIDHRKVLSQCDKSLPVGIEQNVEHVLRCWMVQHNDYSVAPSSLRRMSKLFHKLMKTCRTSSEPFSSGIWTSLRLIRALESVGW